MILAGPHAWVDAVLSVRADRFEIDTERFESFQGSQPVRSPRCGFRVCGAYREDILIRKNGIEHAAPEGYLVNAHEIQPGVVYKDSHVTVTAFPVKHGEWEQAFGLSI
jgi:hypothetical protein